MPSTITVTYRNANNEVTYGEHEDNDDTLQIAVTEGGQLAIMDTQPTTGQPQMVALYHADSWYKAERD